MRAKKASLLAALCLFATAAFGQSFQLFQPFRQNALNRISGGVPEASFSVGSDGTVTPTIGTAGTFTRASSMWCPTATGTLEALSTNEPCENAFPIGVSTYTGTRTGFIMAGNMRNESDVGIDLSGCTLIGTASFSANAVASPLSGDNADQVIGAAPGDGIRCDTGQSATEFTAPYGRAYAYLQASTGTPTVTFNIQDETATPREFTDYLPPTNSHDISTSWKLYTVSGQQPNSASNTGTLNIEIIVDDATVNIYGLGFQYTGGSDVWDSNALTTWGPQYLTTTTTADVLKNNISYEGSELTGSSQSAITVSTWVYYPTSSYVRSGNDHAVFFAEAAAFARKAGIMYDNAAGVLDGYFGSATGVASGINPFLSFQDRWVNLTVAASSGDSTLYVDGVDVLDSSGTFSAFTLTDFIPGQTFSDTSSPNEQFMFPIGQTDVWVDQRLTDAEVLAHYNATKGDDSVADPSSYYFPTTGASEVIRLDAAKGNVTSLIGADVYAANGAPFYMTQGPQGLLGIFFGSNSYLNHAAVGNEWDAGASEDFVIVIQTRQPFQAPDPGVLFDIGTEFATDDGYMMIATANTIDLYLHDGTNSHITRWTHSGADFYKQNKLYTLTYACDRSNTTCTLTAKKEGETATTPSVTSVGTALSSLGAITPDGVARLGLRNDATTSDAYMELFQIAFASDTLSYDASSKP